MFFMGCLVFAVAVCSINCSCAQDRFKHRTERFWMFGGCPLSRLLSGLALLLVLERVPRRLCAGPN